MSSCNITNTTFGKINADSLRCIVGILPKITLTSELIYQY